MSTMRDATEADRGGDLQRDWPATRAEGLRRLAAFQPSMGGVYAKRRNHDLGPDRRDNVSLLSPYVRRRLVSEEECVRAAAEAHGRRGAEKFIQEVFWRTYWKGWLELRPSVWRDYAAGRAEDRARLAEDRTLAARVDEAETGRTGLPYADAWARELVETGYLHNHARMWFASIWVFTLALPWRLGADFFLRHLLDGDPASNTLGWRWVAGLHTRGKVYAAQDWNIAKFTGGRFRPERGDLADDPEALDEPAFGPAGAPPQAPRAGALDLAVPTALLITEEDLSPETLGLDLRRLAAAATLQVSEERSDLPVSPAVADFDRAALADAAARAEAAGAPMAERLADVTPDDLVRWARRAEARRIATAYPPVGPVRDWLDAARPTLRAADIALETPLRPWDEVVWPHATAGFFKVKEKIPRLMSVLTPGL